MLPDNTSESMPDNLEIELDYDTHTQRIIQWVERDESILQEHMIKVPHSPEFKADEKEYYSKPCTRYSMLCVLTLKDSTFNIDDTIMFPIRALYESFNAETIQLQDCQSIDIKPSAELTHPTWAQVIQDINDHESLVSVSDVCDLDGVRQVQSTQKIDFSHFTKVLARGAMQLRQLHNEYIEESSKYTTGASRGEYNYSTLLYGLCRRIPKQQYKYYQVGMKALRQEIYRFRMYSTKVQPSIVMAYVKPQATRELRHRRSYARYLHVSACSSIVDNALLANYSVYNPDDINTAFYIRFSEYSCFHRVLQQEIDTLHERMHSLFTQDNGEVAFLCDAKVAVYQGRNGVNMYFVGDNQSELLSQAYTQALQQCCELYNTMHFMGLDAFYKHNGGTEKVMVHLSSYRVPKHKGKICYVQQFGEIYDDMNDLLTRATLFTNSMSTELSQDYEQKFESALSTPAYLVRESVRMALSAPANIVHKYARFAMLSERPEHMHLARAAIALVNHDSCTQCDHLFSVLYDKEYPDYVGQYTLFQEVQRATHILASDIEILNGAQINLRQSIIHEDNTKVSAQELQRSTHGLRFGCPLRAKLTGNNYEDMLKCSNTFRAQGMLSMHFIDARDAFETSVLHEAYLRDIQSKYKLYTLLLKPLNKQIEAGILPADHYANGKLVIQTDMVLTTTIIHGQYDKPAVVQQSNTPDTLVSPDVPHVFDEADMNTVICDLMEQNAIHYVSDTRSNDTAKVRPYVQRERNTYQHKEEQRGATLVLHKPSLPNKPQQTRAQAPVRPARMPLHQFHSVVPENIQRMRAVPLPPRDTIRVRAPVQAREPRMLAPMMSIPEPRASITPITAPMADNLQDIIGARDPGMIQLAEILHYLHARDMPVSTSFIAAPTGARMIPANIEILSPEDVECLSNIQDMFNLNKYTSAESYISQRLNALSSHKEASSRGSVAPATIQYRVRSHAVDISVGNNGVLLCYTTIADQLRASLESGSAATNDATIKLVKQLVFINELYLSEYVVDSNIIQACHTFVTGMPIFRQVVASACAKYSAMIDDVFKVQRDPQKADVEIIQTYDGNIDDIAHLQQYLDRAQHTIASLIATGDRHERLYNIHYRLMLASIGGHRRLLELQQQGLVSNNSENINMISTYYHCNDLAVFALHSHMLLRYGDILLGIDDHMIIAETFTTILSQV